MSDCIFFAKACDIFQFRIVRVLNPLYTCIRHHPGSGWHYMACVYIYAIVYGSSSERARGSRATSRPARSAPRRHLPATYVVRTVGLQSAWPASRGPSPAPLLLAGGSAAFTFTVCRSGSVQCESVRHRRWTHRRLDTRTIATFRTTARAGYASTLARRSTGPRRQTDPRRLRYPLAKRPCSRNQGGGCLAC